MHFDDNVEAKAYPHILVISGLHDSQVQYWEPTKWAARLRHDAPNGGPYFLRIEMEGGHGGASGRFEGLKDIALDYAFALAAMGKVEDVDLKED